MNKRRNTKQEEERRHPDSPDGLVYIASCNPDYGKRFAETFRQQQERVKKDERR
ncbi:hypothetical protein [Serratia fonticola]|uniref:hypothetical protein n=1 Tax=Serratia fonticola TaxID=47917 RepID=UPI00190F65A6|nr:hypothetical protein [Serratia fonticola]